MSLDAHSAPQTLHERSQQTLTVAWAHSLPKCTHRGGLNLAPTTVVLFRSGITWISLKMQKFNTSPLFFFFSFWEKKKRNERVKTVRKRVRGRKCWSVDHKHKHCKMLVLITKQPHNSKYAEVAGCFQKMLIHHHQKSSWEHTHRFWRMVFLGSETKFLIRKKRG